MMIFYDIYYRRYGVRKASHLVTPVLPTVGALMLPKKSIYHHMSDSYQEYAPSSSDFLFRNITKPIQTQHIYELGDNKGNPRKLAVPVEQKARVFHTKNRRFFRMRSLEAGSRDDNSLILYNYGFIDQQYRYMRSLYSEYYRWWNLESALWKNINEVAAKSDRQHFIELSLPAVLPSISELRMGVGGLSQRMLRIFSNRNEWMLLELWKWLGVERSQSVIANVSQEHLGKVNVIYQESGRWLVFNLGQLNQWRKTPKDELDTVTTVIKDGLDAPQLQRRLLVMMMALMKSRTDPESLLTPEQVEQDEQTKEIVEASTPKEVFTDPETKDETVVTRPTAVEPTITVKPTKAELEPTDKADTVVLAQTDDFNIDADLEVLEKLSKSAQGVDEVDQQIVVNEPVGEQTLEDGVMSACDRLADLGMMSAGEYRKYKELAGKYKELKAPDGRTLEEFVNITEQDIQIPETVKIKDIATVPDKSMLASTLLEFDKAYVTKLLARDVASMVLNIQHAGIAVTGYEVERVEDVMGGFDSHTVRISPVEGANSTLRFKLPIINEDGTYVTNGVKYRVRKQRGDLPIRKISPSRVALTSYYGKVFVSRNEKNVNDYGSWIRNNVMVKGLDKLDSTVTDMEPSSVFDSSFACPRAYSTMAAGFRGFTLDIADGLGSYDFNFDHTKRVKLYGQEALSNYEQNGSVIIATNGKDYLVMDVSGAVYRGHDGKLDDVGNMESLLGLDTSKAPIEFADLRVLGKSIPIGIVLGYELGLSKLMALLRVVPRRVQAGARVSLQAHEYSLVFSDETLVFSRDDQLASMVLAGFGDYHRSIRQYACHEFDKRGIYLNVLEGEGNSTRYLREIDLLYRLFIDPITRDLLVEMQEPTDFRGLLMRSCEMLLTDQHPDEIDPAQMRIKGYERMAGTVYSEIVRSIRAHAARPGRSKLPIDLNPYAVWIAIAEDPAKAQVSDINPIQNLKEVEAVTYSGTGGRGSRSMTKHTRVYHRNDMGTMSESTVDSSDVGINVYLSANPKFTSLRGLSSRYDLSEQNATSLMSTTMLLSPGSDRDDPKRVNFAGIQQAHTVACAGYTQMPVRTGYEQVIAHRTGDLFCQAARQDGKVIAISTEGVVVEYADGEQKGYALGRRYGNAAGLVIPHEVTCEMIVGQKFKEGEIICYNKGFFEKDLLNPNNVVWKAGAMVKTVLMESTDTLEDSSAISTRAAGLLTTRTTKVKEIVLSFDQSIRKLVKTGDTVEPEDILCIIEDAVTANSDLFDDNTLDTLRVMSAQTPLARVSGVVERIEVYYHGDKEDMSDSLKAAVSVSDKEMTRRFKAAGKKAFTGSVDDSYRVDGEPLAPDTLSIRIYITSDIAAGVGDKGVFCNQMKTVFGRVMSNEVTTESGKVIDAIFGQKSIQDRIVLSPEIIGTTATLLDLIGKKAVAAYKKK